MALVKHREYVFDQTGTCIVYYGHGKAVVTIYAHRNANNELLKGECLWIYVVLRMIYEMDDRKELSIILDLHKTYGKEADSVVMGCYKKILQASMRHVKKVSVVGDVFQCTVVRMLLKTVPMYKDRFHFFLNFQKAKRWLRMA